MSEKSRKRSTDEQIAAALQQIIEMIRPIDTPLVEAEVREEWRRRYAGAALEALLQKLPMRFDDMKPPFAQRYMDEAAALSVMAADALLAALAKEPVGQYTGPVDDDGRYVPGAGSYKAEGK